MPIHYSSFSSLAFVLLALGTAACSSKSTGGDGSTFDAGSDTSIDTSGDTSGDASAGMPSAKFSTSSLFFVPQCPGETSETQTLELANTGDTALALDLRITGTDAADFIATPSRCDIAPGMVCKIAVTFVPTTEYHPETATLETTLGPGWTIRIALGTTNLFGPAPFGVAPTPTDFGAVTVGTTGTIATVTLQNNAIPGFFDCAKTKPNNGPYTVSLSGEGFFIANDGCSGKFLPVGGTCPISIGFRPTSVGMKKAVLTVGLNGYERTTGLVGNGIEVTDAGAVDALDSGVEVLDAAAVEATDSNMADVDSPG